MTHRFRLPMVHSLPTTASDPAQDVPPLLRQLRLGEPFALGTAVLFRCDVEAANCVSVATLEDAPVAASHVRGVEGRPSMWNIGYAVGSLPAELGLHQRGDADVKREVAVIATSLRVCEQIAAVTRAKDGAVQRDASVEKARPFLLVPVAAVSALGALSSFHLRRDAAHRSGEIPSPACLLLCTAAESAHAEHQAALLSLLVSHRHVCCDSSSPQPPPMTTFYAPSSLSDSLPHHGLTRLRGVHVSGETAGAASSLALSTSFPHRTFVVCLDQRVSSGVPLGLACLRAAVQSTCAVAHSADDAAGWMLVEKGVLGVASASSAVKAVRVTLLISDSKSGENAAGPPLIYGATLSAYLDPTLTTVRAASAKDTPVQEGPMAPWLALLRGIEALFPVAAPDAITLEAVSDEVLRCCERLCGAIGQRPIAANTVACALQAAITAAMAESNLTMDQALRDLVQGLSACLWQIGVAAVAAELNKQSQTADTRPTAQNEAQMRTVSLVLATQPATWTGGVLPRLAQQDVHALVADGGAEGTTAAWRSACAARCEETPGPEQLGSTGGYRTLLCGPPLAPLLQRRAESFLRSLHLPHCPHWPSLGEPVNGTRVAQQPPPPPSPTSSAVMRLSGVVDVVYMVRDEASHDQRDAQRGMTASTWGDLVAGLSQLYTTVPTRPFSFASLARDYLYPAASGYCSCPSALTAGLCESHWPPHRADNQIDNPMYSLRAACRHRDACVAAQRLIPGCRTGIVLGASYAVVAEVVLSRLVAWRRVCHERCASLLQRVARGLAARQFIASRRVEHVKADCEALWRHLSAPDLAYWSRLEADRSALVADSCGTAFRSALATRAQTLNETWRTTLRHLWQVSLETMSDECTSMSEEVAVTLARWRRAQTLARAAVLERVSAHEAAARAVLQKESERRAHRAKVQQQLAHESAKSRDAEEREREESRLARVAARSAARQDSLKRAAQRTIEMEVTRHRDVTDERHEKRRVDQHIAHQQHRIQAEASLLAHRRYSTLALTHARTPSAPTRHLTDRPGRLGGPALTRDVGLPADEVNTRDRATTRPAAPNGLVHSTLEEVQWPTHEGSTQDWRLSRDLAALTETLAGRRLQ